MTSTDPRVAIVTGASQGIGEAICDLFRDRGVTTVGVSRSIVESEFARRCDIKNETSVQTLISEIIASYGKLDILVNNAAVCTYTDALSLSEDEWNDTLDTNLKGAFLMSKHAIAHMLPRNYGKIVNVSSIAGRNRSIVASVAYTSSKYGLIGLTRQLAFNYAASGININCVCPSQTETPMLSRAPKEKIDALVATIPARRLGKPSEIAECAYFLCSDGIGYVNGAVLDINGAQL